MNDDLRLLEEMATSVFEREDARPMVTAIAPLDDALWQVLEDTGLTRLAYDEAHGGGGGDLQQLLVVLKLAGKFSAEVPLAESELLAGWLLGGAKLSIPLGPMTFANDADVEYLPVTGGWSLKGAARRVPWGSKSTFVVMVASGPDGPMVALVPSPSCAWRVASNMAGEPRDDMTIDTMLASGQIAQIGSAALEEIPLRASLGRAVMMSGASQRALELALEHVKSRTQFGRPIGNFQSVQHDVAKIASYCRALEVAAASAAEACGAFGFLALEGRIAVLALKAEANRLGTLIARMTHQLFGAIGFTDEHELRLSTTRLWSWCQEDGATSVILRELGSEAVRLGKAWELITPSTSPRWVA